MEVVLVAGKRRARGAEPQECEGVFCSVMGWKWSSDLIAGSVGPWGDHQGYRVRIDMGGLGSP